MGFKKEKLLSGLLARKPHSPKELQTHTSPVLHEKVDSLHRCKSSAQSDQITESDDKSLACKGRVCGKHEELDSKDRKCLCERKLQHDRLLETLSDAPSVPQIPPPANRKQEPHESVPSSRVSITPDACSSLELASSPDTEVEVKTHAVTERRFVKNAHHNLTKSKDSSKLSVILSHTIPLSSQGSGGDSETNHCAPIPNVSRVQVEGPSSETMPLRHRRTPRHARDHDYCIQAFDSTLLNNSMNLFHDKSYSFCLPDYSICSSATPSITWGVPYQPATVTGYQIHPVRSSPTRWEKSSCWNLKLDTKEDLVALQNIGLTRINLEMLAETGSISESLFSHEKSREDERRDRVKERGESFVKVMQGVGRSYWKQCHQVRHLHVPSYEHVVRNNPIIEKWLKIDQLTVEKISQLLDDTADILYGRKEAQQRQHDGDHSGISSVRKPDHHALVKRQPAPRGYRHSPTCAQGVISSPQRQRARVISSVRRQLHYDSRQIPLSPRCHDVAKGRTAEPALSPQKKKKTLQKMRTLFARSLASTKSTSKEDKSVNHLQRRNTNADSNSPVRERSRSISSRENSAISLAKDGALSRKIEKRIVKETMKKREANKSTISQSPRRSLRSRTINISTKMKQPVKPAHERNDKEQESDNKDEKEAVSTPPKDWVKLSEDWMKQPLNGTTFLALL